MLWFCVVGDVGLMNMGMNEEDYVYLSTEVDFIVHAAAYVNLIYPYQVCRLHCPCSSICQPHLSLPGM